MTISEAGQFALFLGMGMALATGLFATLAGPIGKAIAQRIRGDKAPAPAKGLTTGEMTAERMAMLEERIAELESEKVQVEERLDFAERVLAQGSAEQRVLGHGEAP